MKTFIIWLSFIVLCCHCQETQKYVNEVKEKFIDELKQGMEGIHKLKKDLVFAYNHPHGKTRDYSKDIPEEDEEITTSSDSEMNEQIVNIDHDCGSGEKEYYNLNISTCGGHYTVRINEYFIDQEYFNASEITVTDSTCETTECTVNEFFIDENLFEIGQFKFNKCVIFKYNNKNNDTRYMSEVDISLVCDNTTLIDSTHYAYNCSTMNLVCDDKVISNHFYSTTDYSQFKNCFTVPVLCNDKSQCTQITVDCPEEYHCDIKFNNTQPCNISCNETRLVSHCLCPPDKKGKWCEEQSDVECNLVRLESNVQSFSQSKYLDQEDPNEEFAIQIYPFDGVNDIEISVYINCTNQVKYDNQYQYWINTSSLIFSSDPERQLQVNVINFYHFYDRSENFASNITKEQYLAQQPIKFIINSTFLTTTKSWNGDLLYAEIVINPHLSSTSFALSKFYIQRKHTEEKYNKYNWIKQNWLVLILVTGVFLLILMALLWYYWKNKQEFVHVKEV
ncbi:hypothetical protein KM1_047330 [Entamoeba histolytica HM-3:IMSS]|uniref:EGF-like domain-containing protein n=2 Tax=Entamoeba histolytica TaxID=5759 RepID=M2S5C7_ENTHI|nr:Hypothetical protein EHI5A_037880 [Entamoeba histolytica KU27]EMS15342.1 hypothetical protein KM1_047330 [Entamoeba histolytica HM-3:IMSS]